MTIRGSSASRGSFAQRSSGGTHDTRHPLQPRMTTRKGWGPDSGAPPPGAAQSVGSAVEVGLVASSSAHPTLPLPVPRLRALPKCVRSDKTHDHQEQLPEEVVLHVKPLGLVPPISGRDKLDRSKERPPPGVGREGVDYPEARLASVPMNGRPRSVVPAYGVSTLACSMTRWCGGRGLTRPGTRPRLRAGPPTAGRPRCPREPNRGPRTEVGCGRACLPVRLVSCSA